MSRRITPVILSGGGGMRLWPLSRADRPKQFIALSGERSMLQQTALRAADRDRFEPPLVVASADHAAQIAAQLSEVGLAPAQLILEPEGRNTAPAIALAALSAGPNDILLVMPSDHLIANAEAFQAALDIALPLARDNMLVTFGIAPDRPETGYGYIRRGEPLGAGAFRVDSFVEKPDLATAEAYLAQGGYDWNGGIFLFRAEAFLDVLEALAPAVLSAARASLAAQREDGVRIWPDLRSFARAPAVSVDVAVMEKAEHVAVVPVDMGWSDIGSWEALHQLGVKDAAGNVTGGRVVAIDTRDCLIRSEGPVIVPIGVDNLVIVATERAVLIVPRGESQRVKEAIEALQAGDTQQP
jgi:mannose-1-phosphate guanylyltransferase/mannose-1-phosphate guanylyltransferase/mannose-6-phosphate isomerase